MEALITYREVLKYARVNDKIATCDIADICTWEENEFRGCLGLDFQKDLQNTLEDYSGVAEWEDQQYSAGVNVSFEGLIYRSKVITTNNPLSTDWELAPKFSDTDYEYFWCRYLGAYLASVIMKASLPTMHAYITASGPQKRNTRDSEPLSKDEYYILQRSFETNIEVLYSLMQDYVTNDETGKFENFGIKAELCGKCRKHKNDGCKCNKKRSGYFFGATENIDKHYFNDEFY